MKIYAFALAIGIVLTFSPQVAKAEITLDDAVFASDVQEREPMSPLTPRAVCENGNNGHNAVPVFNSASADRIYFWNRLQTDSAGVLRHTWYMDGGQGWQETAQVDLNFVQSSGYRTWSSKKIVPSIHSGDWKVEVSTSANPGRVLCTARFRVQ